MPKIKDLSGFNNGYVTALSIAGKDPYGRYTWLCRCHCGNEFVARSGNILTKNTKSCGCKQQYIENKFEDKTGNRYGRLTVVNRDLSRGRSKTYWICKCDCGNDTVVWAAKLDRGITKSCGCYRDEKIKEMGAKHMHRKKEQHHNWKGGIGERDAELLNKWRKNVFTRDNYKCVRCGSGGKLAAHHISPFETDIENRYNLDNGATLCESCHIQYHKTYGFRHFKPDTFKQYCECN